MEGAWWVYGGYAYSIVVWYFEFGSGRFVDVLMVLLLIPAISPGGIDAHSDTLAPNSAHVLCKSVSESRYDSCVVLEITEKGKAADSRKTIGLSHTRQTVVP